MPRRYICRECKNVKSNSRACDFCGEDMEILEYEFSLQSVMPYVLAGAAGLLLLFSFWSGLTLAIWFTFPLIAIGLILDHLFQKELDKKAKNELEKDIKTK